MFTVSEDSWKEHEEAGIAAINDPAEINPNAKNKEAMRQGALTEVSGIRKGDIIFFYMMGKKKILGVYEATTNAFYDVNPLLPTAREIKNKFPFRVGFRKIINFPNPISIDDLWASKEEGKIWTIQQSRGDAVGVHACVNFSKEEGEAIIRMFKETNIKYNLVNTRPKKIKIKNNIPISLINNQGILKFEKSLQSQLLEDFAKKKHQEFFGEYDDFLVNVPTSARKEIDLMLLSHDKLGIVSYQIIELQNNTFDMEHVNRLILYEQWIKQTKEKGNPRKVYSIAIAANFKQEVIDYVKRRPEYNEKIIRLIKYKYDSVKKKIVLQEI